ncbi:MAG: adenylate/guanylate cyclase domain-containing protein, partial [Casimicrobiaceae bacterium]
MSEQSVLTFLFTDIEGSASKWEEQPEQMPHAIARHDALLREAVRKHSGRIVKTTGDGIYAAFEAPADGMAAAVTIQLALADPSATSGVAL